jgi:hypothetical protein
MPFNSPGAGWGCGGTGATKLSLGAFPTEGSGCQGARAFQDQPGPRTNTSAPFRLKEHPRVILSFNHDSPPAAVPNAARFLSLRGLVVNESPFDLRSWEIAVRTEKHKEQLHSGANRSSNYRVLYVGQAWYDSQTLDLKVPARSYTN